jgi:hypothetical protein
MLNRLKITLLAAFALTAATSCEKVRDSREDCGVWLEFVFDHNMDYLDSFGEAMRTVDVLVFDAAGKFYAAQRAAVDQLDGGKRMFLGDAGMPVGTYSVLAVAGLTEPFSLSATDGGGFAPGETTVEEVMLALRHTGGQSSDEFPHLWFGKDGPVEIDYRADLSVWRVPLIRQTNRFGISFIQDLPVSDPPVTTEDPLYTFEIVAPESGAYDYRNDPRDMTPLTYRAFSLASDIQTGATVETRTTRGNLNTMRLLADGGYALNIRNYETGALIVTYDLIGYILARLPRGNRPDGTPLPLQEYLDRKEEWNIVIRDGSGLTNPDPTDPVDGGYLAVGVVIGDWIYWLTNMGV